MRSVVELFTFHSSTVVRISLHWPHVANRILIRKLTYLEKFLSSDDDSVASSRIFKSLATDDVYNVSLVQQCRMLEAETNTNILAM